MKAAPSPVVAAKNVEKQLRAKLRAVSKEGKELKRAEERSSAAFQQCPVALCIVDLAGGRIQESNLRLSQLAGYAPEELAEQPLSMLIGADVPNPLEQFQSATMESAASLEISVPLTTKDGAKRHALWSLRELAAKGDRCAVIAVTEPGDWTQKEYDLNRQAAVLTERIARLQDENADHIEQKERLLRKVGELVQQAGQLKSDAIRLRQMQQELTNELLRLKEHAGILIPMQPAGGMLEPQSQALAEPERELASESVPAATEASAVSVPPPAAIRATPANDQLARHIAALRDMAQRIEAEIGRPRSAA